MYKSFSAAVVIGLLTMGTANSASLLTNGSFEDSTAVTGKNNGATFSQLNTGPGASWDVWDNLNGWTKGSGSGIEVQSNRTLGSIDAQEGVHYVELDSNNNSSMFQDVFLAAGDYVLSFFYSPRTGNANTNGIDVSLGGVYSESFAGPGGALGSAVGTWSAIVRNITVGTDDTYRLTFGATLANDSYGGLIDNVALVGTNGTPAPVPLPAPALLLGAALGGLGLTRKMRKHA